MHSGPCEGPSPRVYEPFLFKYDYASTINAVRNEIERVGTTTHVYYVNYASESNATNTKTIAPVVYDISPLYFILRRVYRKLVYENVWVVENNAVKIR